MEFSGPRHPYTRIDKPEWDPQRVPVTAVYTASELSSTSRIYAAKESSMADKRVKKFPRRILVPLTEDQHDRLRETWLAGGPAVVEQIRRAIDQALGQKDGTV